MSSKVLNALKRLQRILPLTNNQQSCSTHVKLLHQEILYSFIKTGTAIKKDDMMSLVDDIESTLYDLKQKDLVVFNDQMEVIGAYPFTIENREHKINVNGYCLNAMCALDALSVSSMFQLNTVILSLCRVTQAKIHIEQHKGKVINTEQTKGIHIGITWSAASSDVCCANNLCLEILFLISPSIANEWLSQDKLNREIFTLSEAIDFGSLFFDPLLNYLKAN